MLYNLPYLPVYIIVAYLGDMVKYFLYVYPPDSNEELNVSRESDLGNSSVEYEAEQTKDGGWYSKALDAVKVNLLNIAYLATQQPGAWCWYLCLSPVSLAGNMLVHHRLTPGCI